MHHHCIWRMQSVLSMEEGWFAPSVNPEEHPLWKGYKRIALYPVLSSYVTMQPYWEYQQMLTFMSHSASGKKSIEQCPTTPTSALELLYVLLFPHLVYPCALYYRMLILSQHSSPPSLGAGSNMCSLLWPSNPCSQDEKEKENWP